MGLKVSAVSKHKCGLGEGPLWDADAQVLYWVDIHGPTLYQLDYETQSTRVWNLPGKTVGSLAVREQGGLVLAMDHGFYFFSPDTGDLQLIADPLKGRPEVRFNDGKVDPFGSFVAGGFNMVHRTADDCPAFRLTKDLSVEEIMSGFSMFNGPCFDEARGCMYVTGRHNNGIEILPYSVGGLPGPAATFFESSNSDGATIDEQGCLWTAQWSDECIVRLTPDGKVDAKIAVPDQVVSSVMFGGPELDLIYVTTLGTEIAGTKPRSPTAGQTFAIEGAGYKGHAEPMFKG